MSDENPNRIDKASNLNLDLLRDLQRNPAPFSLMDYSRRSIESARQVCAARASFGQ